MRHNLRNKQEINLNSYERRQDMTILSFILLVLMITTAILIFAVVNAIFQGDNLAQIIFVGIVSLGVSYLIWSKIVGFFGGDLYYIMQFTPILGSLFR